MCVCVCVGGGGGGVKMARIRLSARQEIRQGGGWLTHFWLTPSHTVYCKEFFVITSSEAQVTNLINLVVIAGIPTYFVNLHEPS